MPRLVIDLESWRITKKEETKKQEVSNNDAEDSYKEEGEKKGSQTIIFGRKEANQREGSLRGWKGGGKG